eukprot:jgi/Galph1/629/GphlegSOOS_G5421.1
MLFVHYLHFLPSKCETPRSKTGCRVCFHNTVKLQTLNKVLTQRKWGKAPKFGHPIRFSVSNRVPDDIQKGVGTLLGTLSQTSSALEEARILKKVVVAGATGFVGKNLVELLSRAGVEVVVITRDITKAKEALKALERKSLPFRFIPWSTPFDINNTETKASFVRADAVINLAGAPLTAKKWSDEYKKDLLNSRVESTKSIVELIKSLDKTERPKVFVNTSAIGYYGVSEDKAFDESSPPGDSFLATLCRQWESAAQQLDESFGTRVVILRFGIVLGPGGGALSAMVPIFRLFMGGPVGSGRQWVSWIQIEDLKRLILYTVTNEDMKGVYNACSPNPVTMKQFCETLGGVISRPSWLPAPSFAIRLAYGEGATVLLDGQKVHPSRTLSSGFQFQYHDCDCGIFPQEGEHLKAGNTDIISERNACISANKGSTQLVCSGLTVESELSHPAGFSRRSGWLPLRLTEESLFGWPGIFNFLKSLLECVVSHLKDRSAFRSLNSPIKRLCKNNKRETKESVDTKSLNLCTRGGWVYPAMELVQNQEEGGLSENKCGSATAVLPEKDVIKAESVWCLPDEIISSLLSHLDAKDLISLEFVNKRFRDIVRSESAHWRNIVRKRWSVSANAEILETASLFAGGWKRLYIEKHLSEMKRAPWIVPSKSELEAILEIIKGDCSMFTHGSPVGVNQMYNMHMFPTQMAATVNDSFIDLAKTEGTSYGYQAPPPLCIAILIDGSSSVTEEDFTAMKEFCRALLASLRLTHPVSQASIIQFNQYPRVEAGLSDVSKPGIMDTVEKLEQMMGSTDIATPIRRAHQILATAHRDSHKVIILMTDGQTHAEEFELSIQEARKSYEELSASFYAFGVGRDVDEQGISNAAEISFSIPNMILSGLQRIVYSSRHSSDTSKGGYFTLRKLRK